MIPLTIELDDAVKALDAAVLRMGHDYVYDTLGGCHNFTTQGFPSCIVGHVYAARKADRLFRTQYVVAPVTSLWSLGRITCDKPTLLLMAVAQHNQDRQVQWGESVRRAKRAVNVYFGTTL